MSEIINSYSIKLVNSLFLTVIFLGAYLLCKFLLTKHIKIKKIRSQYISRWKYFFFILFMFFFIKIWVEGFLQILAFFGFFAAAFTLTQRENLMNMVGWIIINWRGLFLEEDHIRIANFTGSVKSIGFLYFTLIESNPDFPNNLTGRIIKIPNGMVSRNPIMNFSQEKYIECTLNFVFKPKGSLEALDVLYQILKQDLRQYMLLIDANAQEYEPRYTVKIRQEKPAGYEMLFLFYCKYHDKAQIQYKLNKSVIDYCARCEDLVLSFD